MIEILFSLCKTHFFFFLLPLSVKRCYNIPTQLPFLRILSIGPTDTSTVWCGLISGMGRTRQWCCSTSLSQWVWWQCTQPGNRQVRPTNTANRLFFCRYVQALKLQTFYLSTLGVGENHCLRSPCTHICLLSAVGPAYYSCACPSGWTLAADQVTCTRGLHPAKSRGTLFTWFIGEQIRPDESEKFIQVYTN